MKLSLFKSGLAAIATALAFSACPPQQTNSDAGVDTSCGIDCAAQNYFGLIAYRCFEYSASNQLATPPDLGAVVKPKITLEGGIDVIPVEYSESGQPRMIDNYTFVNGALFLARRTFLPSQSITYKDGSGNITGVAMTSSAPQAGDIKTTQSQADVNLSSGRQTEDTTFKVTTVAASNSELSVPIETYSEGFALLTTETPDHGSDPRRILVPQTGFVLFSTFMSPTASGAAREYRLQTIRDVSPESQAAACSLGSN